MKKYYPMSRWNKSVKTDENKSFVFHDLKDHRRNGESSQRQKSLYLKDFIKAENCKMTSYQNILCWTKIYLWLWIKNLYVQKLTELTLWRYQWTRRPILSTKVLSTRVWKKGLKVLKGKIMDWHRRLVVRLG